MRIKSKVKTYRMKRPTDGMYRRTGLSFEEKSLFEDVAICASAIRGAWWMKDSRGGIDIIVQNSKPKNLTNYHIIKRLARISYWRLVTGTGRFTPVLMAPASNLLCVDFPKNTTLYVSVEA